MPTMADVVTEGLKQALEAERRIAPRSNVRAAWEELLKDSRVCTRCDLYKYATQTVFGEGPLDAQILFVGEQPGDQEDLAGRPFVGPAGAIFDAALAIWISQKVVVGRLEYSPPIQPTTALARKKAR